MYTACIGEVKNAYNIFVEKCEGKRPLGKPRHKWKDSIKVDLKETGWGLDGNHLTQVRYRWQIHKS
jgi:hypothetical protein